MCGEQALKNGDANQFVGSPPRVRGTAASHAELFGVTGITPACAGNSYLLDLLFQVLGDHPRVCGEQLFVKLIHNLV